MADELRKGLEDLEAGPRTADQAEAVRGAPAGEDHPSVAALRSRFADAVLHHEVQASDEHVVFIAAERVLEVLRWLRTDPAHAYDFLADVTAVDYGGGRPLQVVYQLWSNRFKRQLRLKAELPLDALEIDSAVPVWSTANWLEREVYDLFGVHFRGHPDLRRILMPENYAEGHPLRKDFPLRGRFSRAEQTRRALAFDLEDYYVTTELEAITAEDQARARAEGANAPTDFPAGVAESRDARDTGGAG